MPMRKIFGPTKYPREKTLNPREGREKNLGPTK